MQTQEEAAMQEPMQEECSIDSTPQPAQIDAPLSTITGEELRQGDAKILFARWFDRQVAAKRMLVVNGAEIGSGEGDFLIGEGTRSGQDQLYVWELRGKDWTKIATVAQGNGKVELTDLDLEGTPFAIEVEGQLYRSGEVTVPGSAALAVVEA